MKQNGPSSQTSAGATGTHAQGWGGEEGSIEEAQYKVFGSFGRKKIGVKALSETRAAGQDGRKYGTKDMGGVK